MNTSSPSTTDNTNIPYEAHRTIWYATYIVCADVTSTTFLRTFKRRFRVSYQDYQEILAIVKDDPKFMQWQSLNPEHEGIPESATIELLLLGAFRVKAKGYWSFDDSEEATCISAKHHRSFYHELMQFGPTQRLFANKK